MSKVANTSLSLHLQATLWSLSEDKWLITSTKKDDVPVSIIVDSAYKDAILAFQEFYNELPTLVVRIIKDKYRALISFVHRFDQEADLFDTANSLQSLSPLIGITNEETIEGNENIPTIKKIEYIVNNDGMRYVQGCIDEDLYIALSAIANDWKSNQKTYHYVLSKYFSKFESYILQNKGE